VSCGLKTKFDFSEDLFGVTWGHALKGSEDGWGCQKTWIVVAELVICGDQNQDGLCSSSKINDVNVFNAVTVRDLVEAETGQRVVKVVDGGDGR